MKHRATAACRTDARWTSAEGRHQPAVTRPRPVERRSGRRRLAVFPVELVVLQLARRSAAFSAPFGRRRAVSTCRLQEPLARGGGGQQRSRCADVAARSASLSDELSDLAEVRVALQVGAGRRLGAGRELRVEFWRRRVQHIGTVRLVFLEMTIEVRLLAEAALTQRATKRLLLYAQFTGGFYRATPC